MAQNLATHQLKAEKLFSVAGSVCLITGGGTGIGLMCAQALAANGAKVYITSRRIDVLETAAEAHSPDGPGRIIPIGPCDVTSKEGLESLRADLSTKETHLDLLICNAGISGPKANPDSADANELRAQLWEKESPAAWSDVFNTNVTAVYFTTVAFLPLLQAAASQGHEAGNVIVISSMSGIMRYAQGHFSYNAAKGAAVHLTKLMSTEFAKTGVRVNSIAPGYFPSEMTTGESDERNKSQMADDKVMGKGHAVPAGRAGSDEEMAMACLFLARNRYVNGEIVAVDGGVLGQVPG
ncbi:hypothetical protein QBC47DRAFT_420868 [Echria macrotheca]|uniref:Uncharacterized protein n=1 Tax=Echria macrotheca TaxID=438768 RepID=A0AAJ0FDU6_9PEZI|nr:hypothetical protein QBC47DRAFT_420868 [Echria macrotheca]